MVVGCGVNNIADIDDLEGGIGVGLDLNDHSPINWIEYSL